MAYYLTCDITIGNYTFNYANSVEVESSWKMGDKCVIRLPNLGKQLEKVISTGDIVKVALGYDGNNIPIFHGYVSELRPKIPFEIICEDSIYKLKRQAVNEGNGNSWRSITLKTLLKELLLGTPTFFSEKIPDVTLSPFVIEKGVTVAQALQKLKDDYVLTAYFRGNQLYVGIPYSEQVGRKPVVYDLSLNMISNDLVFKRKQDVRIKAKVISILKDNKRIEDFAGDADGEQRTLHFRGITDKAQLKAIAEKELEKYKYDGYRGGFTTFGIGNVIHSQTAIIKDTRYPEREGRYVVDKIITSWGVSGYRRKIELGIKVSV